MTDPDIETVRVGDMVMWDDDEEGFSGLYEVTIIGDQPDDQHEMTDVWLYSSDLGTEVQVCLLEIQGRINPE